MLLIQGVRTRVLLIAALIAVIATVTGGSLFIVRNRVRRNVAQNLSSDLTRSLTTFQRLQSQRREELIHENALLADLPSLKALMTTRDERTIADGAIGIWQISGSDLFGLADNYGRVVSLYTSGKAPSPAFVQEVQRAITHPELQYVAGDGRLFNFSVRPLYFGEESRGTLLGYVISGFIVDAGALGLIGRASGVDAIFFADRQIMASTLSNALQGELLERSSLLRSIGDREIELSLAGQQYLARERDLSNEALGDLRLVVLKSFEQANRAIGEINRLVLLLGFAAVVLGSLLMIALARIVTGPLELLARGVRAFGFGDPVYKLPEAGTKEVRELSSAFARMRNEIAVTQRALLNAERLATIGSMASSVSHDLRHYLSAVYANAEFLSSPRVSQSERAELFSDIQMAVHGAIDMLDSLLIFSKTGAAVRRERDSIFRIVEQAMALLKAHPDAEGISIHLSRNDALGGYALVDPKQVQRAIYNLLLNACQSARQSHDLREVAVSVTGLDDSILLTVRDTGPGVPEHIRNSLFEPFVSEGKQSGTGLGLTLANAIAKEHGGSVTLLSSRPGETIFQLSLKRNSGAVASPTAQELPLPTTGGTRS